MTENAFGLFEVYYSIPGEKPTHFRRNVTAYIIAEDMRNAMDIMYEVDPDAVIHQINTRTRNQPRFRILVQPEILEDVLFRR